MKIIRVVFNDWDLPLIGFLVVNDDDVGDYVKKIEESITDQEAFVIEVHEPDTVDGIVAEIRRIEGEEDEGEEPTSPGDDEPTS